MKILKLLFLNRNVILIFGVVAGLVWGKGAVWTESLILPVLALVMTVATMGIEGSSLRSVRGILVPAFIGIAMNYLVLSGVIILLSQYLITDNNLRIGFILIAAVPPAVAVIPFSFLLRGNNTFSLLGTLGGYLGALVIMPLIAIAFFGTSFITPLKLIIIMTELIFLPLVAGSLLHWTGIDKRFNYLKGPITNWGFSLITYTIVGLNREMFLHEPLSLVPTALIVVVSTFVLRVAYRNSVQEDSSDTGRDGNESGPSRDTQKLRYSRWSCPCPLRQGGGISFNGSGSFHDRLHHLA